MSHLHYKGEKHRRRIETALGQSKIVYFLFLPTQQSFVCLWVMGSCRRLEMRFYIHPILLIMCMVAMSKDPKYRYQSAKDMALDLRFALEGRTTSLPLQPLETAGSIPAPVANRTDTGRVAAHTGPTVAAQARERKKQILRSALMIAGILAVVGALCYVGLQIYDDLMRTVEVPAFLNQDVATAQRQAEHSVPW